MGGTQPSQPHQLGVHLGFLDDQRIAGCNGFDLPRLAGRLVSYAAPQVNKPLAQVVHATGTAQFVTPGEVLNERIAHGLKARAYIPLNTDCVLMLHGTDPLPRSR